VQVEISCWSVPLINLRVCMHFTFRVTDPTPVGKWAKTVFGARSAVLAVFMTHAILNDNCGVRIPAQVIHMRSTTSKEYLFFRCYTTIPCSPMGPKCQTQRQLHPESPSHSNTSSYLHVLVGHLYVILFLLSIFFCDNIDRISTFGTTLEKALHSSTWTKAITFRRMT